MKTILTIPNVVPDDIEKTVTELRRMTNNIKSWSWVNGTLTVTVQERSLLIRGKAITRITYHDAKSWVAMYERDGGTVGRWMLTMSRGDWLEKIEP